MTYLKNNDAFAGTGETNAQGQDLKEFLDRYDPKKYDCPCCTVDIIVLRFEKAYTGGDQPCRLLMVKRANHPCIGEWALPGGFVEIREDLETAAKRELKEETGVTGIPLFQMRTWGDYKRDPRWRIITTSYLAVVEGELPVKAGDDASDALWMDVLLETEKQIGNTTSYRLSLSNKEIGIQVSAQITEKRKKQGILLNRDYKVKSSDGIDMDHAAIITQALVWLKNNGR